MKNHSSSALLLAIMLLGGCAEVSFKAGASADQLRADRKVCTETPDPGLCMKDKGWSALDGKGFAFSSDESGGAAAPMESRARDFRVAQAVPAKKTAPAPTDPMTLVKVNSWWKGGGSTPGPDLKACVAALGDAHKPDYVQHLVTQALITCMRKSGWYAA